MREGPKVFRVEECDGDLGSSLYAKRLDKKQSEKDDGRLQSCSTHSNDIESGRGIQNCVSELRQHVRRGLLTGFCQVFVSVAVRVFPRRCLRVRRWLGRFGGWGWASQAL